MYEEYPFESSFSVEMFFGILIGIGLAWLLFWTWGEESILAQKCAETQGKYDFCVQKVNWEVKE